MCAIFFKCLLVACFVFSGDAGGVKSADDVLHLSPQAETTDELLQAVAVASMPVVRSGVASAAEQDYAEAKRRMLDAEEVAIKRILRKAFGN